MTFKKVQDSKQIGKQVIEGQEIPIIQPEVHIEVKNKKTGTDYTSEEEAKLDISNPNTATTSDDVETNVQIKVTKLPDVFGKTKNS
jgi:fructose-bisphosphate aldolase class 1|tara:strand:- start:73 stop:330 length:258 start_codon:yes stop_codon:yes gene_type:complete